MKKIVESLKLEKELLTLCLFIAVYILYNLFSTPIFALNEFSELYISQATLDGINVSARINLFYKSVFTALLLIPVVYFLLFYLKQKTHINSKQLGLPMLISFTGLFFIVLDIFQIGGRQTIHLFFCMVLILIATVVVSKLKRGLKYVSNAGFLSQSILLSVLGYLLIFFLFNSNPIVIENQSWMFLVVLFVTIILLVILKKVSGFFFNKIATIGISLTLIPILIFISIELLFFFKFKYDMLIPYKWIFILMLALAFSVSLFFIFKKKTKISNKKLKLFYSLSILLSFVLLRFYLPIIQQPSDLFELFII